MNNQEAIEVLKDFDKQVSAKADGVYQTDIGKTACDLAVNALEKQIPKKGIPYNSAKNHELVECPNCHKDMVLYYDYCHYCGQAVDWGK